MENKKMSRFTKERMILEIKKIRELTMEKKQPSDELLKKFRTLQSYGIFREMCNEGFLKREVLQGRTFYYWNFDRKLIPNDYDYFYAKSLKKRSSYYKKKEVKNEFEKEQNKINFDKVYMFPELKKENVEEEINQEEISSETPSVSRLVRISNDELDKLKQEAILADFFKNEILKIKRELTSENSKLKNTIDINNLEIEDLKNINIENKNIISQLKKDINSLTKRNNPSIPSLDTFNENLSNKTTNTKYLKIFGIKIYEKN